jgi:ATPase subunit of ABC transporter with duplicated ATPase domains
VPTHHQKKMSLIQLQKLSKSYEKKPILRSIYLRVAKGDRVGLVGKNGSGKTTILRLFLKRDKPDEGEVQIEDGVRIGYFSQFSELSGEQTVEDILSELFAEIKATEAALKEIEGKLQEEDADFDTLLARQAELFEEMQQRDGWTYANRIDTVLTRLGFNTAHRRRPIDQLSGGWRNRAALAKILLEDPDVLLLDEPTNYLDVEGLDWLENWLGSLRGALVLVSHDRHFLDRVVNRIVEVENYQLQEYPGDFSAYVREKPTRAKTLKNQYIYEEELLAYDAEAIADRREARKDPARALKHRLANIKKNTTPKPVENVITQLYDKLRVRDALLRVEELGKSYDDQTLFHELTFELRRGHRLCILGANGCGKSTLLRLLTLQEPADEGRVHWQPGVQFCSFNQVQDELDPDDTVTHAVNTAPLVSRSPRKQVNQFLQMLQFSELDLYQKIGTLSGGQKARVALARAFFSGASVIVLDEPTNHLDITSTQVMERALIHFPGAVIAVSHDRFFIDKVANRLLVFEENGHLQPIEGNWSIYQGTLAS